jgi:hypothetical protein
VILPNVGAFVLLVHVFEECRFACEIIEKIVVKSQSRDLFAVLDEVDFHSAVSSPWEIPDLPEPLEPMTTVSTMISVILR